MDDELKELIAAAMVRSVSSAERAEQRINFAYGNQPEEYVSSSKESVRRADKIMRSDTGWDVSLEVLK